MDTLPDSRQTSAPRPAFCGGNRQPGGERYKQQLARRTETKDDGGILWLAGAATRNVAWSSTWELTGRSKQQIERHGYEGETASSASSKVFSPNSNIEFLPNIDLELFDIDYFDMLGILNIEPFNLAGRTSQRYLPR